LNCSALNLAFEWFMGADMTTDQIKSAARKIIDSGWNRGDFTALREMIDSNYINYDATLRQEVRGIDGLQNFITSWRTSFPDLNLHLLDVIAEGEKAVCRWWLTGTQEGDFSHFPPSHRKVSVEGVEIYRFSNGQLVENWSYWNTNALLQQIGAQSQSALDY